MQIQTYNNYDNEHPDIKFLLDRTRHRLNHYYRATITPGHKEIRSIVESWKKWITAKSAPLIGGKCWRQLSTKALPKLLSAYFTQLVRTTEEMRSTADFLRLFKTQKITKKMAPLFESIYRDNFLIPQRYKAGIDAGIAAILLDKYHREDPVRRAHVQQLFDQALSFKEYRNQKHLNKVTDKNMILASAPSNMAPGEPPFLKLPDIGWDTINHDQWEISTATTIGYRDYQEDFLDTSLFISESWGDITYCAVFDGHGTFEASQYLQQEMGNLIDSYIVEGENKANRITIELDEIDQIPDEEQRKDKLEELTKARRKYEIPVVFANAITQACLFAHQSICSQRTNCGTTVAISLALGNHIVVGTVGDSEVVFGWKMNETIYAQRMTPPSDPENDYFAKQVYMRGGVLSRVGMARFESMAMAPT